MKVLVPVKRVVDANVKVRVKPDKTGIDLANVKMAVNPFCEIAIEEAVRLKEAGVVTEIIAISVGAANCQEQLRTCLALGADRAILVTDAEVQPLGIAKIIKAIYDRTPADRVVRQAEHRRRQQSDRQMFAALAGLAQGTFASRWRCRRQDVGHARNRRWSTDGFDELPAVVTTDLRLNEPRYASLPNIMKAKKKPMDVVTPADLGVDAAPTFAVLSVEPPPPRKAGIKVKTVEELVDKLRNEAKVIS
jgi:electron transfer flavoprotein beta subunit